MAAFGRAIERTLSAFQATVTFQPFGEALYRDLSFSIPRLLTTRHTWILEWRSLRWKATSLSAFRSVSRAGQRGLVIPIGKLEIRSISLSSKSERSLR